MTAAKLVFLHKKQDQDCSKSMSARSAPQHGSFTTKAPARLNNIGAGLLVVGRNEDALKILAKALKVTKAFLGRVSKTSSPRQCAPPSLPLKQAMSPRSEEKENYLLQRCPEVTTVVDRDINDPFRGTSCPSSQPETTMWNSTKRPRLGHKKTKPQRSRQPLMPLPASRDLFLFNEPIMVDEEECPYSQGRACLMRLSASIIFNMALANHKKGLSRKLPSGANTEQVTSTSTEHSEPAMVADLKKALALYELSCRMQSREHVSLDLVCMLGHMNNMGHIHATVGNAPMANRCFQQLLKSLMLHKKEIGGEEDNHDSRMVGFQQNSAYLLAPEEFLMPIAA